MKNGKRMSLTFQMIISFIVVIALVIGICIFMNVTFLEEYYITNKENSMISGFESIYEAANDGTLESDDYAVTFESMASNGNLSILVMSPDGESILASGDSDRMRMQFMEALFGLDLERAELLIYDDRYTLQKQKDDRLGEEYLILWGTLTDENLVMIRTPLESLKASSDISNEFMIYSGMVAVVIAIVISLFISRKVARPILQLADISKRMADLDFEAKYTGRSNIEIDILGENMNELSENLENTISELKSANNELKIDIEKKEQIDEMRKDFLSNVSHELKTPLALISGYAEGLKECINDDEESRNFYCDVIMDETDKMNQMVKKLLSLNQLEFGNNMISMERFDMTELINGVINAQNILAGQTGIEITFDANKPLYVWGDEFMIEEVITNYMSNAIHHCEGEKKINVSYEDKGDVVRVSVFNTGKPIPEEDIDKVWIKFYKVDKARTREYGGSGIGLSIVKAIMDSHHRECGVKNHTDGVEFWMEMDTTETSHLK
ncbi:MAG: HAMP domain-containing histidine kinase [Lachnospiraceae bacterium]|nr:HAMP domain-containing histidine kinase [Lachnospiraceae bacterium]